MTERKNLTAKEAIQNFQKAFGYTDEAIIRALECCANTLICRDCPLFAEDGCVYMNINYARAEIERLTVELDAMRGAANSYKMHYENAKAEAVKEFAERLETALLVGGIYPVIVKNTIHRLVKEMTEGG